MQYCLRSLKTHHRVIEHILKHYKYYQRSNYFGPNTKKILYKEKDLENDKARIVELLQREDHNPDDYLVLKKMESLDRKYYKFRMANMPLENDDDDYHT